MNTRAPRLVKAIMRRVRLRVRVAFAILALAVWAAPAAADTEHISRRFKVGPNSLLWINSFSGKVTISGSNDPDVSIDAIRYGSRAQLDHVKLDINADSSTVRIDANQRPGSWWFFWGNYGAVDTDFDIKVPRRMNLTIKLFSASLEVQGVDGSHDIETFSSPSRLEDVAGPVHGKSFSGSFDIRASAWRDRQVIEVETFSGRVDLHLPASAQGTVEFDSFSGQFSAAEPLVIETKRRNKFMGRLAGPSAEAGESGSVRVKTFSGNLNIDR